MPHPAGSFTESPPTATTPPVPLLGTLRPADVGFSIERFEYVAASACRERRPADQAAAADRARPPRSAPRRRDHGAPLTPLHAARGRAGDRGLLAPVLRRLRLR